MRLYDQEKGISRSGVHDIIGLGKKRKKRTNGGTCKKPISRKKTGKRFVLEER